MVQVQDVARAVRVVHAARREAGTIVSRSRIVVVEGVDVGTATGDARGGDTEDAEAVVGRLIEEDLTRVVVDDLPLLLTGVDTAEDVEDVALSRRQAEEIVTLCSSLHREGGVVERAAVEDFTSLVGQRIGRAVPSVTKGVEHHELHEEVVAVTARQDAAAIVHGGITIVVEGFGVGTTADLSGLTVPELDGTTADVTSDDGAVIDVHHRPTNLGKEASATGNNLVTSTDRDADRILTCVGTAAGSTVAGHGSIKAT